MSQDPLKPGDIVRVTYTRERLGAGKRGPIPDLRVFRTEWHAERDAARTENWSQLVYASAPGVGSVRFGWCATGGYLDAFGQRWKIEVQRRAPPPGWFDMETAPMNATWVLVLQADGTEIEAHWAQDLSGEEQPPFRGWYVRYPDGGDSRFRGIPTPLGWRKLPVAEPR